MVYKKNIIEGHKEDLQLYVNLGEICWRDGLRDEHLGGESVFPQFYQALMRTRLDKSLNGKAKPFSEQSKPTNTMSTMLILQYRGNKNDHFSEKLRKTVQCLRDLHHSKDKKCPALPQNACPTNVAE